ncbi:hypothetical protein MMC13_003477 [Lambiella insularis]|nr:hypothetical protein [Lambiella insularis]
MPAKPYPHCQRIDTSAEWRTPSATLKERMQKDRETQQYTDLTITCGTHRFATHRLVIGTASPVLSRMINGPFQEAHTGIIDLSDSTPDLVALLLAYFYQDTYSAHEPLLTHIRLYILADEYDVESLMSLAAYHVERLLYDGQAQLGARGHGWKLEELVEAIEALWYEPAPPHKALRRPVMSAALFYREELLRSGAFEALVRRGGGFVWRFLKGEGYQPRWGGEEDEEEEA